MKYQTRIGDKTYEVELTAGDGGTGVSVDGNEVNVDYFEISAGAIYSIIIDGRSYELWVRREGKEYEVFAEGRTLNVAVLDERRQRVESMKATMPSAKTGFVMKAPMPAVVTAVLVEPGQEIKQGDVLCQLEAMKMENEMAAEANGVVAEVKIAAGDGVEQNDVLIVVE
ncbi:MAG: biotin/lipoyl-binding protein [Candidatus Coatesbacteria bacterium]|nr:MAG: biotin/lipoyl-binding protein [Candidatus Coatesbacteria bacterium]